MGTSFLVQWHFLMCFFFGVDKWQKASLSGPNRT